MRGRKPKPTALKKLSGNPGKRKLNAQEPQFANAPAEGQSPANMPKAGREFWRKYYPILQANGVMTEADLPAFEVLCRAWARLQEADDVKISWAKAFAAYKAIAVEFGMTPSARSRVKAEKPAPKDEFAEFIGGDVAGRIGA